MLIRRYKNIVYTHIHTYTTVTMKYLKVQQSMKSRMERAIRGRKASMRG